MLSGVMLLAAKKIVALLTLARETKHCTTPQHLRPLPLPPSAVTASPGAQNHPGLASFHPPPILENRQRLCSKSRTTVHATTANQLSALANFGKL